MTWNRLALAGAFVAAFALAACGDDEPDDTVDAADAPAVVADDTPAMEAESPAMEAEAPAMEAEAPAGEVAGDPPVGGVALLSLADLAGNWAPDAASCEANENVVEISATTLNTPEDACQIASSATANGAVEIVLACDGGASETWTVSAGDDATPPASISIAAADDTTSLVRCTN